MTGQLERIRIFLDVLDQSSFAGAARLRGISPPAVTRAVAELEQEVGAQLLIRTTRKVAATFAGQSYAEQVRRVVGDLDRADGALRALSGGAGGTLRISAPVSFGTRYLPEVIAQFRVLWPDVLVSLDLSDGFVDIVEGGYDMALRISGPPSDKSSIWRKIAPVERVMVAAPGVFSGEGPEDLRDVACLGYSNFAGGDIWALRDPVNGAVQPVPVRMGLSCDNGDALAGLAERGQGVALLPLFIVRDALAAGRLVQVLPGWRAPDIWLTAFYPPYQSLPPAVARLTDTVEAADWACLS